MRTTKKVKITQFTWYIIIAVIATVTIIVIGVIIFLVRNNSHLKRDDQTAVLEPPRSFYSQSQHTADEFEHRQHSRLVKGFEYKMVITV